MIEESTPIPSLEEEQIRELNRILRLGTPALVGPNDDRIELPESVYRLLKRICREMDAGRAISLVHKDQQLTTQAAANCLGFSRPHLIKLLNTGVIPYQRVGQHRRVLYRDVLAFQKKRDVARRAGLNELAKAEFADGMYEGFGIPEGGSDE